jgi:hypothetical protein
LAFPICIWIRFGFINNLIEQILCCNKELYMFTTFAY